MAFGPTPTDGSTPNPIPMSSVVPWGTGAPVALEGGTAITVGGWTVAPVSVWVRDGNDAAQGTTTDAANANTVIGQLKQIKTNTASVVITSLPALPTGSNVIGVIAFGGTTTLGVPSNNGLTVVKAGVGRLASVIVTNTGSVQLNIYDNVSQASGTIIGAVPAYASVGSVYAFNSPAANGIVANAVAGCCATTICYY
jgi:hypothetical protein